MSRLPILIALAALGGPIGALAAEPAAPDAGFAAFQSLCGATGGAYPDVIKAASADGWVDTPSPADTDTTVSITAKTARSKSAGGEQLMLLASQGLRHAAGGDIPVSTCKVSTNKHDAGLLARAQSWFGFPPDGGDATLAVYYVKPGGAKPQHVAKEGLAAALASGGFAIVKFQQDADGSTLVYQTYSK
jgi:hypothetical protein